MLSSSPSSLETNNNDQRCFNPDCNVSITDTWRTGWRLRNLNFATLCNRCGVIYEEGRFCETFHLSASGWRCCETCGKQVHCGCTVSNHTFVLLDAGGIECTICARNNVSTTLCPIGQPPLPHPLVHSPIRNSRHTVGSTSPGSWQQSVNQSNKSSACSESRSGTSSVGDLLTALHSSKEGIYSAADVLTGFHSSVSSGLVAAFPQKQSSILSFGDEGLTHNGTKMLAFAKQGFSCSSPVIQAENRSRVSTLHSQQFIAQGAVCNQLKTSSDGVSLHHSQIGSDKFNDKRAARDLFPLPLSPDGELQKITDDINHGITPLFYKTLTATDTRNEGQRLLIPKKFAETFFPRISLPKGIPLTVQDRKGKEWTFKFRFWHCRNDRLYALEGMANCMKSLQLQAGDAVTFGRREPDGKLIMGFRKAATSLQSEQAQMLSRSDNKPGYKAKKAKGICSPVPNIRQDGKLSLKRKLPKIDSANIFGRKVNLEDVQGLFRSPPNSLPHAVVVEDFLFEEYEEAPVIGRPTIIVKDCLGGNIKWAQCDDCLKWRKLPSTYLLPARWTCSENVWDPDSPRAYFRESKALLSSCIPEAAHKRLCKNEKNVAGLETLEVLDSFTSGRISKGNPASNQSTKKHPRHRPGCLCIVCNQSPSRVRLNHHENCACGICNMVKLSFQGRRGSKYRKARNRTNRNLKHKSKDNVQSLQRSSPKVKQNDIADKSCTGKLSCDKPAIRRHVNRNEDSDEDAGV